MGSETEVLNGLTGVLRTSKEQGVASGWCSKSQLIQSQSLSSGSNNACTSGSGEAESSNAELWYSQQSVVVGDASNNHNGLVVRLLRDVGHNSGEGHRRSVDARHKKSAEDNLVEGRLSSAWEMLVHNSQTGL